MLNVINAIELCRDGKERRLDIDNFEKTIAHRIRFGKDDGGGGYWDDVEPIDDEDLTGPLVAARFRDQRRVGIKRNWRDRPGSYTGGQMPYGIIITVQGVIQQCLRLSDYGPHARRWSARGFGVGFVGDFRKIAPTTAQIAAAKDLLPLLVALGTELVGHTDLPGASGDPGKVCPGELFPLPVLSEYCKQEAGGMSATEARRKLEDAGVVL